MAVNDRVGARDLFGRCMTMTKVNVADALAAASVLCMGEADEQTPVALIEELPFVRFSDAPPTAEEQSATRIDPREDVFGQLLRAAPWRKRNE
jgi:F420-0:gamma-glutamyl ligase